ncbi:MAG: hypothetical protein D3908_04655, partial [Candidatus Electrothrix sp. AUS4]|nr:hypothetical protein [Candidatus Electrothrix sp. AUS4]
AMIEYFNASPLSPSEEDSSIRLTPSVYGAVPLSEKALPYYYYNKDSNPAKAMKYKDWSRNEAELGYWYGHYEEEKWQKYDLEQYNFVRIEGHINSSYIDKQEVTVKKKIKDLAHNFQLPFAVIALRAGKSSAEGCITEYLKNSFTFLQGNAENAVSSIVVPTQQIETPEAIQAAKEAKDAAVSAVAAVKKIEEDAKVAVGSVISAVKLAKATIEKMDQRNMATQNAINALTAETKPLEEIRKKLDNNAAIITEQDKKVVDRAVEAIKIAVAGTSAAVGRMEHKDNLDKLELYFDLNPKKENPLISYYNSVVSFAYKIERLKNFCKEIVSFLHWLDTAHTKYQHCMEGLPFTSFGAFIKEHPGIQHKSGVPIGGTFILVHKDNKVIADFCLPYRVTQPD